MITVYTIIQTKSGLTRTEPHKIDNLHFLYSVYDIFDYVSSSESETIYIVSPEHGLNEYKNGSTYGLLKFVFTNCMNKFLKEKYTLDDLFKHKYINDRIKCTK